jgi:hypothetical protein
VHERHLGKFNVGQLQLRTGHGLVRNTGGVQQRLAQELTSERGERGVLGEGLDAGMLGQGVRVTYGGLKYGPALPHQPAPEVLKAVL